MKLNPEQAPLYGQCVLTIELDDGEVCHAQGEEEFYLLFSGSTERHMTSTLRVSHNTLQAVCPAHNVCEQVLVTLCLVGHGRAAGTHSQEPFCFVQDLALDMAHFLLDNTAPQEALLLDDEQILTKECEGLDQCLALALKHLAMPHQINMAVTHSRTDVDGIMVNHTATVTATDRHVSTPLDSCSAVFGVQLSLLQKPGGLEALSTSNAQRHTAVTLARSRGHFTQYEKSSNVQVEPKEQLHFSSLGRVLLHNESLGTFTLTYPSPGVRDGGTKDCCLQDQVEKLRRLIHLHKKINLVTAGTLTHTLTHASPVCERLPCSNGQQQSQQEAGGAVQTAEEQGSPPPLAQSIQREDSAVVTRTSCTSRELCHSQEAEGGQKAVPAAYSSSGRNRKNKKKTAKSARQTKDSPGNDRSAPEAERGTAPRPPKTPGSKTGAGGTISVGEPTGAFVTADGRSTKSGCNPFPIKPMYASGADGKCADRKVIALPTPPFVEKQEEEKKKWEAEPLMCERVVRTEPASEPELERVPAKETQSNIAPETAAERTVTMGQEQSQDAQDKESNPEKPCQPAPMDQSPPSGSTTSPEDTKPRRRLWRDGGWIAGTMRSPPHEPDTPANTIWYRGESLDQDANEDWNSQSIWYDSDGINQRGHQQPEQGMRGQKECDLSSARAPQLLEQVLSSHGLSATALSQPHAAGTQPVLSHGSGAQRREVHGSQPEKEAGPDWREGENRSTETTHSRKSSETADGEEKQDSKEKGAKGRRKRRKKRGKRGEAEAKLSPSSSVESQSHIETQRQPVANHSGTESDANDRTERADGQSEPSREEEVEMHLPSRTEDQTLDSYGNDADVTNLSVSCTSPEVSPTDHARGDLTDITASQASETKELLQDESIDINGSDDMIPHSTVPASELDITKADIKDIMTIETEATELELKGYASSIPQAVEVNVEAMASSEKGDSTVAGKTVKSQDQTGLVKSECQSELPFNQSTPTEHTEELFLLEIPEQNPQHVQSVDSVDKPGRQENPVGIPIDSMESFYPTEIGVMSFEGTADVLPVLKGEGSTETTPRAYLEHCSASEMLRDQQHREEKNTSEDLVATAVAVVTVAIASAMASIELRQQLKIKQSESQKSASIEPENYPPLAQDANVLNDTIDQLAENLLYTVQPTQLPAQLMNKDKELATSPADKENLPIEHSDRDPSDWVPSKGKTMVEISEVLLCNTETEQPLAAQLSSSQQANPDLAPLADTSSLLLQDKKEIHTETGSQNKRFTLLSEEEDSLLQASVNALPEEKEHITAKAERQCKRQTEKNKLQETSQLPCPVIDTGQHPEALSETLCPDAMEKLQIIVCTSTQDQSICQKECGTKAESGGRHLDLNQTHGIQDDRPVEAVTAECEVGRQCKTEESCEKGLVDMSEPQCQAKEHQSDPQLGGQVTPTREGQSHSKQPSIPISHCDLSPLTDLKSEEATVPLQLETDQHQSSQSSADTKLVPFIPVHVHSDTIQSNSQQSIAMDNEGGVFKGMDKDTLDTVDGWRERDRTKMITVEDTSQTEAECLQTGTDSDSTPVLQIQRGSDAFCPIQPCPEAHSVAAGTDVHPDPGDCVSVCLRHGDTDTLKVCAEVDDTFFKKPGDPPPRSRHRDRPSQGALPVGTPSSATHQSSRLSWKSETEDTRPGGEEDEQKNQLSESAILRVSLPSLSPPRPQSWELGMCSGDVPQRSLLKSLSGEARTKPSLHRRSMSWCPSNLRPSDQESIDSRSYSVECLEEVGAALQTQQKDGQNTGSLLSFTEEHQGGDHGQSSHQVLLATTSCPSMFNHQTLTKSISMVTISHRDIDGVSSFSSNSGSLDYSISEEEPGPLRSDAEGKGGPKISRTFSYLRSKMSKKGKEKEKERKGEKERESKDKKSSSGHVFIPISPSLSSACQQCTKHLHSKEALTCHNCGVQVHKCCRDSLPVCTKSKTKQQFMAPEAAPGSAASMRSKSTSSASSVSSTSSSCSSRERWSSTASPEEQPPPRSRHQGIFTQSNLAKSISTSNIAGLDDVQLKGLKFLSESTDSLNHGGKVDASTESLTDEGTEMMDSQLMGEFEWDIKDLEADSWSGTVDKKFLKALKKDEVKRQDVIYELYQTEVHHVRTLKIMSEVYYKGLQKELQLDTHTLDKIFPVLDDLLETHTHLLTALLERKRASSAQGHTDNSFLICSIGDILLNQFSGCSAERMKKVYGKFCSRHNEAVNFYKDLHAKDKRFQAFIKRTMSSSIVRRLSIPECILLVTQRITKYPGLIQRILQHTKDADSDHGCVCEALHCVKTLITAVDSKVNEQEKKHRLTEVYSRTDSKSIMRMKSGQMFAKEDLVRGRRLLHDGALQLKNSAGRLKEVQAMLLSDVLVFLQEKDQKYIFASLDQRSTVISLQNLIVREVANEERGLFLITAGIERPEMVEVLASSKEERNTWRTIIQDAMHCMEKEEDEGVPSETEEDKRQQENRAKKIRELLRRTDDKIISLLEEKIHIFRDLGECNDNTQPFRERTVFRATPDDVTKGEPIMKDALREVEDLHALVNSGVAGCSGPVELTGGNVGPVCLPRRAETFGGFDCHQMSSSKSGEKEEDESLDLRRTESDSVLKKGATASLQVLLKRNNEVQRSVIHLHELLISLQAVVVQQDSFIEEQRQAVSERLTSSSSRHSSSSSLCSSFSSRPSSIIEQEKHRSLERQRQEAASLQKQQAAHQEEKRRREKAWELKERDLSEREHKLRLEEEDTRRRRQELGEDRDALHCKREDYQKELERLREAQRRLDRDRGGLEAMKTEQSAQLRRFQRSPSTTSEESLRFPSTSSLDLDSKEAAQQSKEVELSSSAPTKEPFLRIGSKRMGRHFNPFSSSKSLADKDKEQPPSRLLQLAKPKDKKKKKVKAGEHKESTMMSDPHDNGDVFFC